MTGEPLTLGDLIHADKLLWVYCRDCGHERDVNPANVPLPPETLVPEIGKHMRCSLWVQSHLPYSQGPCTVRPAVG